MQLNSVQITHQFNAPNSDPNLQHIGKCKILTPRIINSNGAAEDHRARACDGLSRRLRPIQGVHGPCQVHRRSSIQSKAEEEHIILLEIEILKPRLSEPQIPKRKMKEYIIRLICFEMLGHEGSFAYIHAVKMTHDDNLLLKRTSYLAFFSSSVMITI
ncbi:hypothetical protein GBA52_005756 [Prunus armeniaca]|nr:hypothetical protein GBA52_005756 [Prunus armeniaca]